MIIQGRFANADGEFDGWVAVNEEEGIIEEVGRGKPPTAAEKVLPSSQIIFPGFVDVHVHAREDRSGKQNHKETYATLAQAALHGGVTHVGVMPNTPVPLTSKKELFWHQRHVADLPIGFTHYVGVGPRTSPLTGFEAGTIPYKVFTGPSVGRLFFTGPDPLFRTLEQYPGQDVSFHVEDNHLLEIFAHRANHALRRPEEVMLEALPYVLEAIETFTLKGKICHWPIGGDSFRMFREHRSRGFDTVVEVAPQYMIFDTENTAPTDWPFRQANPALQSRENRLQVIDALRRGVFQYMATDHAPHTLDEKLQNFQGKGLWGPEWNYRHLCEHEPERAAEIACTNGTSGMPQLDTYGLVATWLMRVHDFKPEDIARVCSENPGKWVDRFTDGPHHGRIEAGYRADFTVLDVSRGETVTRENIRSKCAWSPYEGMRFPGSVAMTIIKGKVAYQRAA